MRIPAEMVSMIKLASDEYVFENTRVKQDKLLAMNSVRWMETIASFEFVCYFETHQRSLSAPESLKRWTLSPWKKMHAYIFWPQRHLIMWLR